MISIENRTCICTRIIKRCFVPQNCSKCQWSDIVCKLSKRVILMDIIVQFVAVFTLLLYKYVCSVVEIHHFAYRYFAKNSVFYWHFIVNLGKILTMLYFWEPADSPASEWDTVVIPIDHTGMYIDHKRYLWKLPKKVWSLHFIIVHSLWPWGMLLLVCFWA